MIRLINLGKKLPYNYVVDPMGYFEPGMIGMFYNRSSSPTCGVSDGHAPIGIIDDVRNANDDSTYASGRITIWNCDVTAYTDQFESNDTYHCGDYLGVSKNGKLAAGSSIHHQVAKVLRIPSAMNPTLEFLWIPQLTTAIAVANLSSIKKFGINTKGVICSKCNTNNEYINDPNQPDGTYICYSCRSGF